MNNNTFTLHYNVSGSDRKTLVGIIAREMETKATYLGAPHFEYQVGDIIIGSQGEVTFNGMFTHDQVKEIVDALAERGFKADETAPEAPAKAKKAKAAPKAAKAKAPAKKAEPADEGEKVALTVALPLDKVNLGNLTNLLDAKGSLIQKALGIKATPIEMGDDTVTFPWFEGGEYTADEVHAYSRFICALCEMSVNQTRVTAKEKPVDNEKFAFRCFLIRLGFIGDEFKRDRKVLLRNLTGNSAFKSGAKGVSA